MASTLGLSAEEKAIWDTIDDDGDDLGEGEADVQASRKRPRAARKDGGHLSGTGAARPGAPSAREEAVARLVQVVLRHGGAVHEDLEFRLGKVLAVCLHVVCCVLLL